MKNTFLYLFVFSLLINIFQFVNTKKFLTAKDTEIQKVKHQLSVSRDSISDMMYNDYFSIEKDEQAQDYFYNQGLAYEAVMQKVNDDLAELNTKKGGNPLIPYEAVNGKSFLINTAKILNHRWIVAEYSNGDLWGQILVKYFYNSDKSTDFETVETVLYAK